jgi:ribonuclease G
LIENGQLAELYIERKRDRGVAGNIYKGRVVRVLPGMQAAFVDIGLDKAAFLYVADVRGGQDDFKALFALDEEEREHRDEFPREELARHARGAKIEELLKEGQEVTVQVAKEPIGTKGARSTSYVSLPGRHLVFMPTVNHVGISRRIGNDKERKRLREIIDEMRPEGTGFIVRTVAEGVARQELRDDMEFLIKLWHETVRRAQQARAPSLLYSDLDLLLRTVRDLFTAEVSQLIIDSRPEYERVMKFVAAFMPEFKDRVHLYSGLEPIFDGYGIEAEIDRALERKVFLKSGGSLVIDQGEALTAIDVNTGRFVGKRGTGLEDTITKNNLEACREVADQLRLRNIGGIIVVDFIDMDRQSNREKVSRAFEEALRADKAKAAVTRISELGLVEMTRKRTRESLQRMLTEPCPYCEGKGYIKSKTTICYQILRDVRREGLIVREDAIVVSTHPEIADLLLTADREYVEMLEKRLQKQIILRAKGSFHLEQYEIQPRWAESLEKDQLKKHDPGSIRPSRPVPQQPREPAEAPSPEAGATDAGAAQAAGEPAPEGEAPLGKRRRRRRGGRGRKRLREGVAGAPVSPEQLMHERGGGASEPDDAGDEADEPDVNDDQDEAGDEEPAAESVEDATSDAGDEPVRPPGLGEET